MKSINNKGYTVLSMLLFSFMWGLMIVSFYYLGNSYNVKKFKHGYDSEPRYRIIDVESNNLTIFVNNYNKDKNGDIILGNICNGSLLFSHGNINNPLMPIFNKDNKQVKCEFIKQ